MGKNRKKPQRNKESREQEQQEKHPQTPQQPQQSEPPKHGEEQWEQPGAAAAFKRQGYA